MNRQTVGIFPIRVFDNASQDDTASVIAGFPNAEHIRSPVNLGGADTNRALSMATAPYVMFMHDDDMLHPRYMELALDALNRFPRVNLVSCPGQDTPVADIISGRAGETWRAIPSAPRMIAMDSAGMSLYLEVIERMTYCACVMRADAFRRLDIKKMFAAGGKWCDRTIQLEMVASDAGSLAVCLPYPMVHIGRHAGQETSNVGNLPPPEAFLRREALFCKPLGDDFFTAEGFFRCMFNRSNLCSGWKRRVKRTMSRREYFRQAVALGAATRKSLLLGLWVSHKPMRPLLQWACERYLERRGERLTRSAAPS